MEKGIKLTYFKGGTEAELTRLILRIGGVEYEDCKLT